MDVASDSGKTLPWTRCPPVRKAEEDARAIDRTVDQTMSAFAGSDLKTDSLLPAQIRRKAKAALRPTSDFDGVTGNLESSRSSNPGERRSIALRLFVGGASYPVKT